MLWFKVLSIKQLKFYINFKTINSIYCLVLNLNISIGEL